MMDCSPTFLIAGQICEKILHFMIKNETWFMARLVINKIFEGQSHARNAP